MAINPTCMTIIILLVEFTTPRPSSAAISCLVARQLCSEQKTCNQILEVIPKTCGLEIATCSTNTVTKCQAALRTLRGFDYFSPTCLCKEPRVEPKCNQLRDFIFDHPCDVANSVGTEPYPIDALPTCSQAHRVCTKNRNCLRLYNNYQKSCRVDNGGQCRMEDWRSCQTAWANLRLSPLFGCICPKHKNAAKQANCDKIFSIVNGNPCIDARFFAFSSTDHEHRDRAANFWQLWYNITLMSQDYASFFVNPDKEIKVTPTIGVSLRTDSRQSVEVFPATPSIVQTSRTSSGTRADTNGASNGDLQLRSTCHLALDACERDGSCNRYLDQIKRICGSINCDRQKCMRSIRDFYENIPEKHRLAIAFCICKNQPSPDEQCLQAQSILHPVCAQQPDSSLSLPGAANPPSCHELAKSCKRNHECEGPLERFEQSCAVDSTTKSSCSGRPDLCRKAMIGILGTELRTTCDCNSVTADFRQLYECIGWQRIFWQNPCTDEAAKDYYRGTSTLDGSIVSVPSYTDPTTMRTVWEMNTPRSTWDVKTFPPRRPNGSSRRTKEPPATTRRVYTWPQIYNTPSTRWQPPTPFPTIQYITDDYYPTPPWPTRRTRPPKKTSTIATTTSTTTTTLPPQFCSVERPGQPVRYIREGYKKRLYKHDDPECSELCECNLGEKLFCQVLECIKRDACNTGVAFYSHASPFYQAYRGACLCYSGSFVCSKPAQDVELNLPQGVYLFLGYSEKDEKLLKAVTHQGAEEARGAIQGMVSFHNVNSNKSECRIIMATPPTPENLVLQAVMDEFEENREKGNLTAEILNKEKEECFEALQSIERKIMSKDADMRSHVILSMIKVARAEADIPPLPSSATSSKLQQFLFKGSCSSLHMAGSCCNLTNFLVVFNILIILLRSNCQVIVAL